MVRLVYSFLARLTAIHVLLAAAALELAMNRVAVPMLRPRGEPPGWHVALDYVGLFLFYFAGALAALVLVTRCYAALRARDGGARGRDHAANAVLAAAALLAAIPLAVAVPEAYTLMLELVFAGAVVALVAAVFARGRDLGVQIGAPIMAIPLLVHTAGVVGAEVIGFDPKFEGPGPRIAQLGVMALCAAALVTPYCFAPRPFARAVTRPVPIIVAMSIAGVGAALARLAYPVTSEAARLAIGVEMNQGQADPRLALYLLAIATFAWTLAACATSASAARRAIGAGLALIVLGGYGFRWPHHYLLPLLGLALVVEAARTVRDEELAELPLAGAGPPIDDATWSLYVGAVAQGLRRTLDGVHSLTMRGEAGLASSVIVGELGGVAVRARIERVDGAVLALDVVIGREVDELRGATFTASALPARGTGAGPPGPPATPAFRTADPQFDERFRVRGSAAAFEVLLDDGLRARAVATLDGWLAYWDREGVRYRVYPGHGAPLDHPIPISDLALGNATAAAERLVGVIELVAEIGGRGVPAPSRAEPAELELT